MMNVANMILTFPEIFRGFSRVVAELQSAAI
jgi:hypothetical protein